MQSYLNYSLLDYIAYVLLYAMIDIHLHLVSISLKHTFPDSFPNPLSIPSLSLFRSCQPSNTTLHGHTSPPLVLCIHQIHARKDKNTSMHTQMHTKMLNGSRITHTRAHTHSPAHRSASCIHTGIHTVYMHPRTHMPDTHAHTNTHTCIHIHACTVHSHIRTCIHARTCTHAHIHILT